MNGERPRTEAELADFVKAIEPLGLSAYEIADALWLASNAPGLVQPPLSSPPPGVDDDWPDKTFPPSRDGGKTMPRRRFPVYPPPTERPSPAPQEHVRSNFSGGVPIQVPMPADSHAGALGRSLRGLRGRPAPGPADAGFDENATADRAAATDVVWPVPRFRRPRRDEALVVVDPSVSMELWSDLESDLTSAVRLSGAFRRWSSWSITRHEGRVTATPRTGVLAVPQRFERLCDPTGRSVVFVLTDGIAGLWHDGTGLEALESLARCGPVAVVEPLPNRLWRRTGLEPRRTLVASAQYGPTATRLDVVGRARKTAVPVAILEAHPQWITDWARLVSGQAAFAQQVVVGRLPQPSQARAERPMTDSSQAGPDPELSRTAVPARQLLRRFQAAASPVATELATALSLVPLTLPIMQTVRVLCFSGSSPVHLAEVISSGLLNRDPNEARRSASPVFQWLPGVREELRRAVTADRVDSVQNALSTYLDTDLGITFGSREFRAIMALSERSAASAVGGGDPFAWVLPETARRAIKRSSLSGTVPEVDSGVEVAHLADDSRRLALRAHATGRSADIEEGIDATRRAVNASRPGDRQRSPVVTDLARLLLLRWHRSRDLDDLDEAALLLREELRAKGTSSVANAEELELLAEVLQLRYEASPTPDYLDEAIHVRRSVIAALPSDALGADRHRILLAQLLSIHHRATGTTLSLYEALDALDGAGSFSRVDSNLRIIADITLAECLDVVSRSTRTDDDMDAADQQWLRLIGELADVLPESARAVKSGIESRVLFLRRSGRTSRADALASAFQVALAELPAGWGA
jgi:hypothetical protein